MRPATRAITACAVRYRLNRRSSSSFVYRESSRARNVPAAHKRRLVRARRRRNTVDCTASRVVYAIRARDANTPPVFRVAGFRFAPPPATTKSGLAPRSRDARRLVPRTSFTISVNRLRRRGITMDDIIM